MSAWEEMVQQVVVDGHPGKVRSAAGNWQALLDNLRSIKESLESNITDLGQAWKGPAYEAFRENIEAQAKLIGRVIEDAEKGEGIVQSLNSAADRLAQAQADMPVPYAALDDILRAREANLILDVGLFEAKVSADFLSLPPVEWTAKVMDWFNDQTAEARAVYDRVNNEFQGTAPAMPGEAIPLDTVELKPETPDLRSGPGAGSLTGMPGTGGMPGAGGIPGGVPGIGSPGDVDATSRDPYGGIPNTPYDYDPGSPPDFDDDTYGTGLAGATPGVGGGGFGGGIGGGIGGGAGGIGGGSGLGGAGGGLGGVGGTPPGGGALGRPVTPGFLPGMMGGMGGGAGSGGRRGAGGLGTGRGGVAALGGRGAGSALGGARAAAGGSAAGGRVAGAGGRGMGGMAAMGGLGGYGAGFGDQEHDRNSWLQEDDDVWGAEGDTPPGVLR